MNTSALDWTILGPAFVAGLLVLSTHVPLGREVLGRGIIFIDLAIAQVAGLGVIAANLLAWDLNGFEVQLAAGGAALLGAVLLTWTERRFAAIQEALIGTMFVLAATGGILFLARNPHGGEQLKDLLVGQILWVNYRDLWPIAALYAAVLGLWYGARSRLGGSGFYLLFAVTVTASVQLVGVYLVFASLIVPALASRAWNVRQARWIAYATGIVGYAAGLILSALLDLPTGAVIVWCLALAAILASAFARNQTESDASGANGQTRLQETTTDG